MENVLEMVLDAANYDPSHKGPSGENCCKVTRGNVCGSGSFVGRRGGKALVLTNAHVIGSRPGTRGAFYFPDLDRTVNGEIIVAAYSDRIYMDWAVCELDADLPLEPARLDITSPVGQGPHYTAGYPSCRGPYYQQVDLIRVINKGTVALWDPPSIGGQSGSAVHSSLNDLQQMLLTWLWGGKGAGQTIRSIWFQYVNQAAIGFEKSDEFIELGNRVDDLENGFFAQTTNIGDLDDIWAHLQREPEPPTDPCKPEQPPSDPSFAKKVLDRAKELEQLALEHIQRPPAEPDDGNDEGPIYGLT